LINPEYVMQFAELEIVKDSSHLMEEPEDLIPPRLAVAAANVYFKEVAEFREGAAIILDDSDFTAMLDVSSGVYDALKAAAKAKDSHIDKIGFARAVVSLCEAGPRNKALQGDVEVFLDRMKLLFGRINRKVRAAEEEKLRHRVKGMVEQQRKIFVQDYPEAATREQGLFLFERIDDSLEDSLEAKAVRDYMRELIAEFGLDGEAGDPIPNYENFLTKLRVLKDAFDFRRDTEGTVQDLSGTPAAAADAPKSRTSGKRPRGPKTEAAKA
jgi:hypothetical protein